MKTTTTPKSPETPKPDLVFTRASMPWPPIVAILFLVGAYIGASIGGEAILLVFGLILGISSSHLESWMTNSTLTQAADVVLVYGLMAIFIVLFIRRSKVSLKSFGVVRPQLRDFGMALVAVPVYLGFYVVLLTLATALIPSINISQQQQLGFSEFQSLLGLILTFVSLVILPPLVEEFVVRGFLFTSLLSRYKFAVAAVITSGIFATAHLQIGSGEPLLWVAAIDTFILSLVLCYMRFRTGSLWPGIFLHMLKNLTAFLVIFVYHVK